jgi:arylsulfatase A-like enzyme
MPTLLALLGEAVPERVTGRDLSGAMAGGALPASTDRVITSFGWYASVRTRAWNYQTPWVKPGWEHLPTRQATLTPPQLYDLTADPAELTNVIADHPDVARELHAALIADTEAGRPLTRGSLDVGDAVIANVPLFDQSRL